MKVETEAKLLSRNMNIGKTNISFELMISKHNQKSVIKTKTNSENDLLFGLWIRF